MQVDGKLLAEESLISYSQMAYSSIFGKFDLKLEETEDGFAIEGDRKKVETFQNIFKAISLMTGYLSDDDLEVQKQNGIGSISRMIH